MIAIICPVYTDRLSKNMDFGIKIWYCEYNTYFIFCIFNSPEYTLKYVYVYIYI